MKAALPSVDLWTLDAGLEAVPAGNPVAIRLTPDSNAKSILHFNAANGSTAITDSGYAPKTWTAYGNAQISTAQSVLGGASLALDGSGDYVSTPAHDDLNWTGAAGTLDFRIRFANVSSFQTIFSQPVGGYSPFLLAFDNSVGKLKLFKGNASLTGWDTNIDGSSGRGLGTTTIAAATWYALRLTKTSAGMWYVYLNGTLEIGPLTQAVTLGVSSTSFVIGMNGGIQYLNGYIDEVIVRKGVALVGNYAPPSSEKMLFSSASDVAESPWISIPGDGISNVVSPFAFVKHAIAAIMGYSSFCSFLFDYALNGGLFTGTPVDEATAEAALQNAPVTDHANSVKIRIVFISDGTQPGDIAIASSLDVADPTGGGGLRVILGS
jgi:Concanavalin A-like lectin/glucanases superfamily